mmetsp:Transcript_17084/g.50980  ORF Transcript_17084/g.50980 Transcript_17084/m.50980 type:complete len:109 (-) Transcript_17084:34-360(-)
MTVATEVPQRPKKKVVARVTKVDEWCRWERGHDPGCRLAKHWSGLRIYDADEGFRGEIIGIEWNAAAAQNVAVVRGARGQVETYCILDLPALIIAAKDEQHEYIVLEI